VFKRVLGLTPNRWRQLCQEERRLPRRLGWCGWCGWCGCRPLCASICRLTA
jgi:hypothetical protein